jgi:endogenous inhibitor of DNA gyrase (YacG/DUF329 family)
MENLTVTCPVCKKKTSWKDNLFRPFCSDRCRLVDLGKWASDEYRIPGEKNDTSEENPEEKTPDEL